MCTAIVSVDPSSPVPVLLVGVRDEFVARSWDPPARHWPDRPRLVGGRDQRAGGTWLAVDPDVPRAATVLNGRGRMAPEAGRLSRGELPLRVAADGKPGDLDLPRFDPFHLIGAEAVLPLGADPQTPGAPPDRAYAVRMWSWDGEEMVERSLGPGLHLVVNRGLEGGGPSGDDTEDAHMSRRIEHFRPRLAAAARPEPRPGGTVTGWGEWLPLIEGDGLPRTDKRALLPLIDLGGGRVWGTTSVSLVALARNGIGYEFSPSPGDPGAWTTIL
ncbi:NRDE family protein [Actinomadura barringtoniae]|uniref:NRDE family protein n=1 Tax=Actinomadura barringtoniae TaxID=1427535 RepID=A0A939PJT6_9ACTN|nr:NRDE family protein [Actinomadura barringtoniae]MBO2449881.1 NRDE family protein [Actinomadura barringtoniae]